jgi:serine phosphatase RsbU (regulator of sigma subunit)
VQQLLIGETRMNRLIYILFLISSNFVFGQSNLNVAHKIDSVWSIDSLTKEDKLYYVYDVSWSLITEDVDKGILYANMLIDSAEYYNLDQYAAYGHSTKAECYIMYANYKKAIKEHQIAQKLYQKVGDEAGVGATLMNMGLVYFHLDEHETARKFIEQSLVYDKKLNDTIGMVHTLINLAVSYKKSEEYDVALDYYNQAIGLIKGKEEDNIGLLAVIYGAKGSLYLTKGQYEKAYENLRIAHDMSKRYDFKDNLLVNKNNLSMYYEQMGKLDLALEYATNSYEIAQSIKSVHGVEITTSQLSSIHEKLGNGTKALKYYKVFIEHRDSVKNDENIEEMTRLEVELDYEIKAAEDSIRVQKEKEVLAAEKEWAEKLNYAFFGGGALIIIFTVFLYNRYRIIGKQKRIIEEQKGAVEQQRDIAHEKHKEAEIQHRIVEEKNREIIDSIQYARRLQSAILPSIADQVKSLFTDAFVYYAPKDIVAGDFYWCEKVDNIHYIAAADCTGHGVPGAMVSVMCSSALSKALVEENIKDPASILDRVRQLIIERFEKSGEEVNDGMDISLAAVHYDGKEPTHVEWAGANSPLWIFRNSVDTKESTQEKIKVVKEDEFTFIQLTPDKQPVGKSYRARPFETLTVPVRSGDSIYLFSDGYLDQFGGETEGQRQKGGKKLKSKGFKAMLQSLQFLKVDEQGFALEQNFREWRGNLEQIDDVCVIGIEV